MMSFKELMDKVGQARLAELPFVIYRKPDESMIHAMIQKDRRLDLVNSFERSGFIMAPFKNSDSAVLISKDNALFHSCPCEIDKPTNILGNYSAEDVVLTENEKDAHLQLVRKAKSFMKDKPVSKVVVSRQETIIPDSFELQTVFERLVSTYPSAFVYLWCHPEIGSWAGATPETLLKTRGPVFRTMSLAGTKKFEGVTDVSWDAKELNEQQLVTDHIVDALEGTNFVVGQTYTQKAGNLLHICTEIGGRLNPGDSVSDWIKKLHPTAAVCGFPKKEAERFILAQEGYERSFYTGFLGELNFETVPEKTPSMNSKVQVHSSLFVNLRCMQIHGKNNDKVSLYIGGGITAASDPHAEWQETVDKSFVMKSILGGSQQG